MIIRRRHTRNYTTIDNGPIRDERLCMDELGLLTYLLHLPNHWQVRRHQLQKRFVRDRLGRDRLRRILRNLIRYGYIVAEITRRPNGTVHVNYEVRDECGPEISADEARSALSLGSSEAQPGESCEDGIAADDADETGEGDAEPPADPPDAACGPPPTGHPVAASRLRQTHPGILVNNDSVRTESESARPDFGGVSENARRIAGELLAVKHLPPDDPLAISLGYQAQAWLNAGIDAEFIVTTAVRVIAAKPKFPHLNYLNEAVRGAFDDWRARPATETSNVQAPRPGPGRQSGPSLAAIAVARAKAAGGT